MRGYTGQGHSVFRTRLCPSFPSPVEGEGEGGGEGGEGVEDPGRRGENRELNGPDTWPGGVAQLGWGSAARAGAGQAPQDEVWKVDWPAPVAPLVACTLA